MWESATTVRTCLYMTFYAPVTFALDSGRFPTGIIIVGYGDVVVCHVFKRRAVTTYMRQEAVLL